MSGNIGRFTLAVHVPLQYFCTKCRCYHQSSVRVAFEDASRSYWCADCVSKETMTAWEKLQDLFTRSAAKETGAVIVKADFTPGNKLSKRERKLLNKPRLVYKAPKEKLPPAELDLVL